MKQTAVYQIKPVNKPVINPVEVLDRIDKAAMTNKRVYLRIFNVRTGKDSFLLHKGTRKYLFRDPKYIEVIRRETAINLLYRLNETINKSNYLDFEIREEEGYEDN